jgi:hypothetical protein
MVQFFHAKDSVHKFVAVFDDGEQVPFGAFGYDDFITSGGDTKKKKLYLKRHKSREDWNDPKTPGALSRWVLWNKPTLKESIKHYVKKFHMDLE